MPTPTVVTGFEFGPAGGLTTGNAGNRLFDVTAGTPTIVSATPRTGTYCLEINPSAATEYLGWDTNTIGASKTVLVGSFAFKFQTSLPTANCMIAYLQNDTSADSPIWFRSSDNKIIIMHDTGGGTPAVGPTLIADTYYQVDFRYSVGIATHTVEWQVDGVAQTTFNGSGTATAALLAFAFGDMFTARTMNLKVDDVVWGTTSGDYPYGNNVVALLKPDTAGTTAEIGTANATARFVSNGITLDTTHNSANILTALSEVPPTLGGSASGVYQRTSGATNAVGVPMTTYTLSGGDAVSGLRVLVCGWSSTAVANNIGMRTFNGTTETILFTAADPNFDNSTTTPGWLCKMATTTEFDTQTEIDALVIRYGYSTDISPVPGAHAIYAEIAVKPSVGGGGGTPILRPKIVPQAVSRSANW